jgi:hypothetical protein
MGRTAPTYRLLVEQLAAEEWGPFRRALRAADRATFDAMLNHAREYASAGSNLAALDPVVPVLLSVMLAHEAELARLRRALAAAQAGETPLPPTPPPAPTGASQDPPPSAP